MKNNSTDFCMSRILFLIWGISCSLVAQNKEIPLWKNIPGEIQNSTYKEEILYDSEHTIKGVNKVIQPTLTPFLVDSNKSNGAAVIICPGGGYAHLAINKEGFKVAKWFNSIGISAFVLKYRLPNDAIMKDKSIGPLQDAQEAIRTVRRNAKEWHLDPTKIGIMGFSAGGHLAATLSTHFNEKVYEAEEISARPDFSILIYPVISMEDRITHNGSRTNLLGVNASPISIEKYSNEKQITSETPKTFLVHASDDKTVPVANSINYYLNLREKNVSAEMHLYEDGGHGFGLGTGGSHTDWPKACEKWLLENMYIAPSEGYLFSYFKGNGQDGLHLAYSYDGYKWEALKNNSSFLTPEVGKDKLIRDPNIILGKDGIYHMVWTVSWTERGIGYASSTDLIHWSKQEFIPVMSRFKTARNTWAPEITYDSKEKKYIIYWASTLDNRFVATKPTTEEGYNHRIYYTTTRDFKKFKRTKLLFNPGFNVIDATIVQHENGYAMFVKDETPQPAQKNIKIAYSKKITGPYHNISEPITGKYWAEGPSIANIGGKQIVYFDKYKDKKYGAVLKMGKEWKEISDEINFPEGTRHGSIIQVPSELINQLKKE